MAIVVTSRSLYIDSNLASYKAAYEAATGIGTNQQVPPLRVVGFKLFGGSAASTVSVYDPTSNKVLWLGQAGIGLNDQTMFFGVQSYKDIGVAITGAGAVLLVFTV